MNAAELTVEHLGPSATEEDLVIFLTWMNILKETEDISEDDAVSLLWGDGDYIENARRMGLPMSIMENV